MSKFAILLDSTCDLPKEFRDKYDLDYCPMNVSWDGVERIASLDWDQGFDAHAFYDVMRAGKRIYTTMVPANVFEEKFSKYLAKGEDVLYITCSSGLSGSRNVALTVAKGLEEKYPNNKVICFDSLISCFAQGEMGIRASNLRSEGKTIDEVVEVLTNERLNYNQFAAVADLKYLRQAGRVSAGSAFFGNLFGVKPIIISDIKGHNFAIKKIKGRLSSIQEIAKSTVENCPDIVNRTIWVCHADDVEAANLLKNEILKLATPKEIYIGYIGPIVGASVGPGTISTFFYGNEVTVAGE
ncbi:MAG: DegV family protein [Bacilli bacterium]|nr:DegV family protein [Bacilli bacterium]